MAESLEERLRSHAKAFDGLLSLIPAKYYYGEDTSDQWQRKKQTKQEARNAKLAKLDPDSAKSAKDVMDENARKRKREEEGFDPEDEVFGSERPKEGLKHAGSKSKKRKRGEDEKVAQSQKESEETRNLEVDDAQGRKKQKAEKKAAKKEKKRAKEEAKLKKKEAKRASKEQKADPVKQVSPLRGPDGEDHNDDEDQVEDDEDEAMEDIANVEGLSSIDKANQDDLISTASPSPIPESPAFDAPNLLSGSSSISSIAPPSAPTTSDTTTKTPSSKPTLSQKIPKANPEELRARLQARLAELRNSRHADGLNGKPARNRQELLETRRRKEEARRAHRKELRQKAKEEEQRVKDEALARRFSPSGSLSGSLLVSPRSPLMDSGTGNNFSFGRIAFADGQQTDASLSTLLDQRKRKGPQDPLTTLKAAESKQTRISGLDETKRADIEQKDMWLNAKRRAHGERVRDDTSLLKKALKRKEGAKKKSEKEWGERIEGLQKGMEVRQRRREDNLRKRREEKGGKKGGKKSGGGGKKNVKAKARPGFEGSFRAKVGGRK